jgi:ATP-dependent DNA helicase RecQ
MLIFTPKQRAEMLLKTALNDQNVSFRDGQWECIEDILNRKRVLVVQHTGWGKSMVYFIATKMLRDQEMMKDQILGTTLLISPLLSLVRNQIAAAQRIGLSAFSINSDNRSDWNDIENELLKNTVDILLISPERLSNRRFLKVLSKIKIGVFVIDEAHCISDWGHDFRPHYKLINRILERMPLATPVLATTATANHRVTKDILSQIGVSSLIKRGSLVRKNLFLQNIKMPTQAARMAWLVKAIRTLQGSGIIYTLTTKDANTIARWLKFNGINAHEYHSKLNGVKKEELEQRLIQNQIKVLVATVALGMGFDKPDIHFVIHFQRPASVIHYYQQVGRAGRSISSARGILLSGQEDDVIADHFKRKAFSHLKHIDVILNAIKNNTKDKVLTTNDLQHSLNLKKSDINRTIDFLKIEKPSPIFVDNFDDNYKVRVNASVFSYKLDEHYIRTIEDIRDKEQQQMNEYINSRNCLMSFLQNALDDQSIFCGNCANCKPTSALSVVYDSYMEKKAQKFLKENYQIFRLHQKWPANFLFKHDTILNPLSKDNTPDLPEKKGKALSIWGDDGWGRLVQQGKYVMNHFDEDLVDACVVMINDWFKDFKEEDKPKVIVYVPSINRPNLVKNFAERLAEKLNWSIFHCIQKKKNNPEQKTMQNDFQQIQNLDGVFQINLIPGSYTPCLLVDDIIDSGWTFTILSELLRKIGCTAVYPLALALQISTTDE